MKPPIHLFAASLVVVLLLVSACTAQDNRVRFASHDEGIDVFIGDALVTTYRFSCEGLKPCLYPVRALDGTDMTRHYPFEDVEGERQDHPHHTGVYFTYDHVNGVNYWDVHDTPPRIAHADVLQMDAGTLAVEKHWIDPAGRVALREVQTMAFRPADGGYAIDFTMTLTPPDTTVFFEDSKEGMFVIRVADWLTEEHGSGEYLSANGDRTEEHIWGRRAEWVRLEGEHEGTPMGVVIMNHPESVNYPTYWHARAYGCFSANPLGQGDFQERLGMETPTPLHLTLEPGEEARFRFRMLIYEGARGVDELEAAFRSYSGS